MGIYQFLSGGGEDNESFLEAAKRETFEESGIAVDKFIELETKSSIPKKVFADFRDEKGFYVITEHSFAYELKENDKIKLSKEHSGCQWMNYQEATDSLKYDSNKTALWELRERIRSMK